MTDAAPIDMSKEEMIARKLCRWRCLTTRVCNSARDTCGHANDPCELWTNRLGLARQIIKEVENFDILHTIDTKRHI